MGTYTKIDETRALIESDNYSFYLDSDPIIGLPEHHLLMSDFETDEEKLNYFITLLDVDPKTAFINYLTQR